MVQMNAAGGQITVQFRAVFDAEGGNRTRTGNDPRWILSPSNRETVVAMSSMWYTDRPTGTGVPAHLTIRPESTEFYVRLRSLSYIRPTL